MALRLLSLLFSLLYVSSSQVEILRRPNTYRLNGDNYLFTDAFISADNRSIHLITREYADFQIDFEGIELYISNQDNVINNLNATTSSSSSSSSSNTSSLKDLLVNSNCEVMYGINASDLITHQDCTKFEKIGRRRLFFQHLDCKPMEAIPNINEHGNISAPCLTTMRPTRISDKDHRESSVVITYTNDLFPKLLSQVGDHLEVAFTYKGNTTPSLKIEARPLLKNSTLSMFTLFKSENVETMKVWIQYYADLGVDQFIFYYNGNATCIDPGTCKVKNKALMQCDNSELSCFIKALREGKTDVAKKYSHVNFVFVAWNYKYWYLGTEHVRSGETSAKHNAQTQAIMSVVYRAKKMVSWLMLFDLDEFAKPGENALSFKEQLDKYSRKDIAALYFKNRWAGFEGRKYSTPQDEVYDMNSFYNELIVASPPLSYRDRSKLIINPDNIDLMGVHQVFSSTLPRPEHVSLSKYVDSKDVHPNIPPELIGLVVSAKASFLHLINQHTDGNKTTDVRSWDILGDVNSRVRYRMFDKNHNFKPVVVPFLDHGALTYSQYVGAIQDGALLPHQYNNHNMIALRHSCINAGKERILSTFSTILKSSEKRTFKHAVFIGPSYSPQLISDNLLTMASDLLLHALGLSIEYCGNSISEPFVDACTDEHILEQCPVDSCLIYLQPGSDWGECIDPAACISDKDRNYRDHILKLGNDHNVTVLSGPQSLMFADLRAVLLSISHMNALSPNTTKITWKQHSAWQFAALNYTGVQSYEVPDLLLMLGPLQTYKEPTLDVVVNLHRNLKFASNINGKQTIVSLDGHSLCKLLRKEMNITCMVVTFSSPELIKLSMKKGKKQYLNSTLAQGIMATTTGNVVITDNFRGAILPYMVGTGVVYIDNDSHSHSYSESIREVFSSMFSAVKNKNECLNGDNGLKEAHIDNIGGVMNATIAAITFYTGKQFNFSMFDVSILSNSDYISKIGGTVEILVPDVDGNLIMQVSTSGKGYGGNKAKRTKQAKEYLLFYMGGLYFFISIVICFGPASYFFYFSSNGDSSRVGDEQKSNQPYLPVNINEHDSAVHEIDGPSEIVDDDGGENEFGLELSERDD